MRLTKYEVKQASKCKLHDIALERALGVTIRDLASMSVDEENSYIEEKIGRKPVFSKMFDPRISARGNHLLAQKRIATMESVDARIMEWKLNE